jgi:hypothetical protein
LFERHIEQHYRVHKFCACRNRRASNVMGLAAQYRAAQRRETVMQYLLLIYNDEERARAIPKDDINKMLPAFTAYTEALKKAAALLGGNRLQFSSNATTVRIEDGKTRVMNGPYAETKEQLGGYYLIDVPDMDSALSWAARCPGANWGTVEVRPVWAMQQ